VAFADPSCVVGDPEAEPMQVVAERRYRTELVRNGIVDGMRDESRTQRHGAECAARLGAPALSRLGRNVVVRVPVELTGVPQGIGAQVTGIWSELSAAESPRYRERMVTGLALSADRPYLLYIENGERADRPQQLITLQMAPSAFRALADRPVTLRGKSPCGSIGANRQPAWRSEKRGSAGCGALHDQSGDGSARRADGQAGMRVTGAQPPTESHATLLISGWLVNWTHALGDARTATGTPTSTWLSPLYRDDTYWQLAQNPAGPGSQWLVPAELSSGAASR
jgi:hypothetical protein